MSVNLALSCSQFVQLQSHLEGSQHLAKRHKLMSVLMNFCQTSSQQKRKLHVHAKQPFLPIRVNGAWRSYLVPPAGQLREASVKAEFRIEDLGRANLIYRFIYIDKHDKPPPIVALPAAVQDLEALAWLHRSANAMVNGHQLIPSMYVCKVSCM